MDYGIYTDTHLHLQLLKDVYDSVRELAGAKGETPRKNVRKKKKIIK